MKNAMKKSRKTDRSDLSEKTARACAGPLPESWREQIIDIVKTEILQMSQAQLAPDLQSVELPPTRKVRSKKTGRGVKAGSRVKIAGTTDAELARLLDEWRSERRLNLSQAIDTALWHFLGKPKLSFEKDLKED